MKINLYKLYLFLKYTEKSWKAQKTRHLKKMGVEEKNVEYLEEDKALELLTVLQDVKSKKNFKTLQLKDITFFLEEVVEKKEALWEKFERKRIDLLNERLFDFKKKNCLNCKKDTLDCHKNCPLIIKLARVNWSEKKQSKIGGIV